MDPATPRVAPSAEASTGELLGRLSEQSTQLIRQEIQLAQAEMAQKAKRVGIGAGLFGTAGLIALYAVGAFVSMAILALALVVDAWLAALIVALVLSVAAGVAALVGKQRLATGTPLTPEATIESVKEDIATVKEARQ